MRDFLYDYLLRLCWSDNDINMLMNRIMPIYEKELNEEKLRGWLHGIAYRRLWEKAETTQDEEKYLSELTEEFNKLKDLKYAK